MIYIINILIIIIALISGWFLKSFFPKYFEEKGKNLATKEDIGEITNIIEKIKSELLRDTEILKAQLSISNQTKFSFESAFRDALFDYNKKYAAWLNSINSFSFSGFNEENYSDITKQFEIEKNRHHEFDLAVAHLNLFLDDEEFRKINYELTKETITLKGIIEDAAINFKYPFRIYNIKVKNEPNFSITKTLEEVTMIVKECNLRRIKQYETTNEKYVNIFHYLKSKLLILAK